MSTLIGIIVGILLVLLNGFFVAIEFALARVSRTKIEAKTKDAKASIKTNTAKLILNAISNFEKYISSAQVGITIASLALGAIGEITIAKLISPLIEYVIPATYSEIVIHSISLPLALLVVTFFHVVIGEIVPKAFAFVHPEKTAFILIWPLEIFTILTSPLVSILNSSASLIMKPFGIKDINTPFFYTEDELKMLLNVSQEEGVIEATEKEMITNIFDFPDTVAREIMTPRIDMHCADANKYLEDAVESVIESKHSRIPIYEDSIDNIVGVVTTRDLLEEIHHGNYKKILKEVAKPIIKVPESISLDDLLSELKRKSLQLAIILDEFGGTAGLVTVEDIIEEIVGEIRDEYDEEREVAKEPIKKLETGDFLIDGKMNIEELNKEIGSNFSNEHHDTIGGLTFGLIGKEPIVGDEVESNGYIIRVEDKDYDKQRIKQVRLIKHSQKKQSKNGASSSEDKVAIDNVKQDVN